MVKIYIYKDNNSFLQQLNNLNKEYNKITYFYKYISNIKTLKKQLKYLENIHICTFNGFYTQKIIKITVTDNKNKKYVVSYKFKEITHYNLMSGQLRKIEKQKI